MAGSPWIAPRCPDFDGGADGVAVDDERGLRVEHLLPEPDPGQRLVLEAHAALDRVRELDQAIPRVEDADVHDLRVKDLLDLVADEVVHRLRLEARREALLDAVDDRQLGRALLGLAKEDVGLLEQARVREGDAHARRDRRDDLLVGLGERVLQHVREDHDADRFVARQDRHAEPGSTLRADLTVDVRPQECAAFHLLREGPKAQGSARPKDFRCQPLADRHRLAMQAPAGVELIRERDEAAHPVVQGDEHVLRLEHRSHALADDLDDRLEVELPCERRPDLVDDGKLGDPLAELGGLRRNLGFELGDPRLRLRGLGPGLGRGRTLTDASRHRRRFIRDRPPRYAAARIACCADRVRPPRGLRSRNDARPIRCGACRLGPARHARGLDRPAGAAVRGSPRRARGGRIRAEPVDLDARPAAGPRCPQGVARCRAGERREGRRAAVCHGRPGDRPADRQHPIHVDRARAPPARDRLDVGRARLAAPRGKPGGEAPAAHARVRDAGRKPGGVQDRLEQRQGKPGPRVDRRDIRGHVPEPHDPARRPDPALELLQRRRRGLARGEGAAPGSEWRASPRADALPSSGRDRLPGLRRTIARTTRGDP